MSRTGEIFTKGRAQAADGVDSRPRPGTITDLEYYNSGPTQATRGGREPKPDFDDSSRVSSPSMNNRSRNRNDYGVSPSPKNTNGFSQSQKKIVNNFIWEKNP